jgi:uncharacterized protein (DUF2267 family)
MLVKAHEFLAAVRDRGEYVSQAEAERASRTVLSALAARLAGGEAKDLAAQLPPELQPAILDAERPGGPWAAGEQEFLTRLAEELGATPETARWDASAVLSTLAEAVSGGELNQLLTQLPAGYAPLFGRPDLA